MTVAPTIQLMRPLLPTHERIIPYLKQIDGNRWYSNFGPLVMQLGARMAEHFHTGPGSVIMMSNGTAGLTNIMRALNLPRGTHCILPAWTFMATAAAVIAVGMVPYFVDVDEHTWALDPEAVKAHVKALDGKVSAVMVVAPFGAPIDTLAWDEFTEETGLPVIIDAAAGFDAFSKLPHSRPRRNPVMISLHATKSLGIGEGGMVISTDTKLIERVQEMSNFGFSAERQIRVPGTNGKMSEYNAAVGLAALDEWPNKRAAWWALKDYYATVMGNIEALTGANPWLAEDWVGSTLNIRLPTPAALSVIARLNAAGIESRQWWGKGCHAHPAYYPFPRSLLPVTDRLAESVLALPFTLDMQKRDIDTVVSAFRRAYMEDGTPERKAQGA